MTAQTRPAWSALLTLAIWIVLAWLAVIALIERSPGAMNVLTGYVWFCFVIAVLVLFTASRGVPADWRPTHSGPHRLSACIDIAGGALLSAALLWHGHFLLGGLNMASLVMLRTFENFCAERRARL
jgi:hypothetical protein